MDKQPISVFWFRRDLRLIDNHGLFQALNAEYPVLPVFIFDEEILSELPNNDPRVQFIYNSLKDINEQLIQNGSSLYIRRNNVMQFWNDLIEKFNIKKIFYNKDYEPYAIKRDLAVTQFLNSKNIEVFAYKDQVIFEENDILKLNQEPYTVFTPYKNKWLEKYETVKNISYPSENYRFNFLDNTRILFPELKDLGFIGSAIKVLPINYNCISNYEKTRDLPFEETSNLSVHLRFGVVSVRNLVAQSIALNKTFTSELIWREFFMQILFHFPYVIHHNFKSKYNTIVWRNNKDEFLAWCNGNTGYPIVDAGMRQLNKTGYMHNRVRMIVASFLCKHLLIDWRWGEAYFAEKLLDYELSSNNGNWQWVAGTGCDAAPYFRVFNPITQQQKFDEKGLYLKKWLNPISNYNLTPIVEHSFARERYLSTLKKALL
jgi:deoxyribodipyrimidine photo-lyase